MKVDGEQTIDPALLFQRMLVISQTADITLDELLGFELSPFPPSLFEDKGILRKADKPQLVEAIYNYFASERPCRFSVKIGSYYRTLRSGWKFCTPQNTVE